MGRFWFFLGGALGWSLGGVLGAIIGAAIGAKVSSLFDATPRLDEGSQSTSGSRAKTTRGDFMVVLMVLAASVMKADGKVTKAELEVVKQYLRQHFSEQESLQALQVLKNLLDSQYNLSEVCAQVRVAMNYSAKMELLHWLFKISYADGEYSAEEEVVLKRIALSIGLSQQDFQSVWYIYMHNAGSGRYQRGGSQTTNNSKLTAEAAYKILSIAPTATDDEVKKAYRKMAMKYHPDKVNTLGEDVRQSATEKFKAVGEAYEYIKTLRGMK